MKEPHYWPTLLPKSPRRHMRILEHTTLWTTRKAQCYCPPLGVQSEPSGRRGSCPGMDLQWAAHSLARGPQPRLQGLAQAIPWSCKLSQNIQSACYGQVMLTFLLAMDICIYHPLLNEPHLSTIVHSYPSIIKTNILQISYVSASLHLRFCLVPIFNSSPSLIFFWNWQFHKMGWNSFPPHFNWKYSEYYVKKFAEYMLNSNMFLKLNEFLKITHGH